MGKIKIIIITCFLIAGYIAVRSVPSARADVPSLAQGTLKDTDVFQVFRPGVGFIGVNWTDLKRLNSQGTNWLGYNITSTGAPNWHNIPQ